MLFRLFGFFSSSEQPTPFQIIQRLEADRVEREIALREAIESRKAAYDIANARERFPWLVTTGFLTVCISAASAYLHRNLVYTLPIPPIISGVLYEAHSCYGEKPKMIQKIAHNILDGDLTLYSLEKTTVDEVNARLREEKETI